MADDGVARRGFLKGAGAASTLAAAGLTAKIAQAAETPTAKEAAPPTNEEVLLTEIRDILKTK